MVTNETSRRRWSFAFSRRTERLLNIATVIALLLLVAVIALWRIPSQYQLLLPATAESVSPKIYVAGHPPQSGRGDLLMTFVSEPQSNLLEEIFARLDPDATLLPLPPQYNASQDQAVNAQLMLSSEQSAELVALCHLGYKDLCSGGLAIQTIESYSKAKGLLKVGDVIVAVNGQRTLTAEELRAAIVKLQPGATLHLTISRSGKKSTLSVPTILSPQSPHHTIIGIAFTAAPPLQAPSKLPIDIKIDPTGIGGPSAGLMFTLGLLNRLSPTDLTHNTAIAGTGEIHLDGSVGPIGGVKQKVIGAQWAHAKYFFVPCAGGNYADATKAVGSNMTLVPVNTLDDALAFLQSLGNQGPNAHLKLASCPAGQ
ncbi:MAG: putative secreted protein [Chloroflexi bacterium]|nr:putative secreted protein [Chloroflexota bacterium]